MTFTMCIDISIIWPSRYGEIWAITKAVSVYVDSLQVFLDFNGEESVYYYVETYIFLFFNPTNLANLLLLFSLLTHFAFIFFAVWSVSLACEQSEKNHFFSLQSDNKNPHIFAYFRFKRIWAAHPRYRPSQVAPDLRWRGGRVEFRKCVRPQI